MPAEARAFGGYMNKFVRTAVATVSLTVMSTAAFAQCMIYSEPNYQGDAGIIQPNDLVMFKENQLKKDLPDGFRTYFDKSWLNNLKSSKTTNSCKLMRIGKFGNPLVAEVTTGDVSNYKTDEVIGAGCGCE